jgi:prepilin-type N-terminal cleavage/methylation domain-containing protein
MRALRITSAGFTLVEMLIAAAVLAVIAGITITTFSSFQQHMVRDTAVESVVSIFNQARAYTLSSKNATSYGVHLASDRAVLFSGTSYNASASDNVVIIFEPGIEVTNISLTGGVQDIVFSRQTGNASATGTFTVHVASNPIGDVTITIEKTGILTYST